MMRLLEKECSGKLKKIALIRKDSIHGIYIADADIPSCKVSISESLKSASGSRLKTGKSDGRTRPVCYSKGGGL